MSPSAPHLDVDVPLRRLEQGDVDLGIEQRAVPLPGERLGARDLVGADRDRDVHRDTALRGPRGRDPVHLVSHLSDVQAVVDVDCGVPNGEEAAKAGGLEERLGNVLPLDQRLLLPGRQLAVARDDIPAVGGCQALPCSARELARTYR